MKSNFENILKIRLLEEEGLEKYEASGEQIIIYATMNYMQTNKDKF
jgi:hypothetical protein